MPLLGGKKNIGRNIRELEKRGPRKRSHAQIVAIALSVAKVKKKKKSKGRMLG